MPHAWTIGSYSFPLKKLERLKKNIVTLLSAQAQDIGPLFKTPLILGASVSAGYAAPGPGTLLSARYTEPKNVKTIAFNGTPGHMVLRHLQPQSLSDRSVIIGVDLFFWDSIYPTAPASVAAIDLLVKAAEQARIPLLLGDIPDLLPGLQGQRLLLNEKLRDVCARSSQCHLVPLTEVFQQIQRDRQLVYQGQRYSLRQLLPDGLHLGEVASAYIADLMETMLAARA